MKKFAVVVVFALSLIGAGGVALADDAATDAARDKIAKAIGVSRDDVRPSPVAGLFEVRHDHDFGYVSADGKYLLQGDLVNIQTGEQITENHRRADRLLALKELGDQNVIKFDPAPPMMTKYVINVFTDVDCAYCRKLHSQIAEYNAQGIAVHYLSWPRSGPNTDSWTRAEAVWCSADRAAALTKAKLGKDVSAKKCDNPVAREYELGKAFGIRGTPLLVLPNGDTVPGYIPPKVLAEHLAEVDAADKKAAALPLSPKG
ncbi:MAG: dsbC [Nevskia sp.]|nr:dsbC [Nevskia sp.]